MGWRKRRGTLLTSSPQFITEGWGTTITPLPCRLKFFWNFGGAPGPGPGPGPVSGVKTVLVVVATERARKGVGDGRRSRRGGGYLQ